jgi:hypothetical protein
MSMWQDLVRLINQWPRLFESYGNFPAKKLDKSCPQYVSSFNQIFRCLNSTIIVKILRTTLSSSVWLKEKVSEIASTEGQVGGDHGSFFRYHPISTLLSFNVLIWLCHYYIYAHNYQCSFKYFYIFSSPYNSSFLYHGRRCEAQSRGFPFLGRLQCTYTAKIHRYVHPSLQNWLESFIIRCST